MSWPIIVIPWKFLAQANHRLLPVVRGGKAKLITAPGYRAAKEMAEWHIKKHWKGQPVTIPLALHARCYFPDRIRRDAVNLSKMVDDAMSGIVFKDDSQIHKETWERTGIDRENPRVEITLEPMPEEPKPEKRYKASPVAMRSLPQHSDGKTPKHKSGYDRP